MAHCEARPPVTTAFDRTLPILDCEACPAAVTGFDRSRTPPIPDGTKPLQHQVAGHVFGRPNGHKRNNKFGFLQSDDGCILKPVQAGGKGERELEFYRDLFNPNVTDPVRLQLQQFVAKYLGVWSTPVHPGQFYLKLQDVTRQFCNPCVMDVKIGPVTYDHEADAAKIAREKAKSPALEEVGFQLVGIKRYDPNTRTYQTFDRNFLRNLSKDTVLTRGLAAYFWADECFDVRLVRAFLRRLSVVKSWFTDQTLFHFFASSLLFVYDGDAIRPEAVSRHVATVARNGVAKSTQNGFKLNNNVSDLTTQYRNGFAPKTVNGSGKDATANGCTERASANGGGVAPAAVATDDEDRWFDEHIDVRMIDFTHVFETSQTDTNYLTGLSSLMDYMSRLEASIYDASSDS